MTVTFAHMADAHLGAFRDPVLRDMCTRAFEEALEAVVEEGARFLVIAGDLMHTNLPDMATLDRAAAALKGLRDAGVGVYVVHGSHDRGGAGAGIVDVLSSAGLFTTVGGLAEAEGGKGRVPEVVIDGPTGAAIAGLGGRQRGLERDDLASVDGEALARAVSDAPLSVFCYHGSVEGLLPRALEPHLLGKVAADSLPPGFDYYALGHVHHHAVMDLPGGGTAAYPGPTFGSSFTDLEDGRPKGLMIVEAEGDGSCRVRHRPVKVAEVVQLEVDVDGLSSGAAREALEARAGEPSPEGALVLLRVAGTLSSGRPAHVGVPEARRGLLERGALAVLVSRSGLLPPEASDLAAGAGGGGGGQADPAIVARAVVSASVDEHASPVPWLGGEDGASLAMELFEVLREERGSRTKADHREWVVRRAMEVLGGPGRLGQVEGGPTTLDSFEGGGGK